MPSTIQPFFVELLKNSVSKNLSLAEELSELLGLGMDSVYRRLRSEKDFTLTESIIICKHFKIPIEALAEVDTNIVAFRINKLSGNPDTFKEYLQTLHKDLDWIKQFDNYNLVYAAEDLPVFYNFFFPNLASFKMLYWNKSILNNPLLQGKKVEDMVLPAFWLEEVPKIREVFLSIPTTEIWNDDTLKSTIQQIRFYWEAGFFNAKETALALIQDLESILYMANKQSESGKKYNPLNNKDYNVNFALYSCDLMIGNNTVQLNSDTYQASYVGHNSFNFMRTANATFNEMTQAWINNMLSKSTTLSQVGEKSRNRFFKGIQNQIETLHQQILKD